ncbi:DUS3L synthase, partial [Alectura lathami]|nr:DUS3L synthase [Alectura lathami]
FLQDVGAYVATKPPDLGSSCVLFEIFVCCAYSVTCCFARAHLGDGYRNVVNADLGKQWEGRLLVRNNLSKELQHPLHKKKFSFRKAEEYLFSLAKPCSNECPVRPEEGGDPKAAPLQGPVPAEVEGGGPIQAAGPVTDEDMAELRLCEKKKLETQGELYLAPLTTCGNLPFQRRCKRFGADVTCGEMSVCTNLLRGQSSEWALLKRHHSEDVFAVQLELMQTVPFDGMPAGAFPDMMAKCTELLNQTIAVDFVDISVGCPVDLVYKKGALMTRSNKFEQIVRGMNAVLDVPLTVKIRTGVQEKINVAHEIIPRMREWVASMVTVLG